MAAGGFVECKRPKTICIGVGILAFLYTWFAIKLLVAIPDVYNEALRDAILDAGLSGSFMTGIVVVAITLTYVILIGGIAFLLYEIYYGYKWARNLYVICFFLWLPIDVMSILTSLSEGDYPWSKIVHNIGSPVAIIYLLLQESTLWYNSVKRSRSEILKVSSVSK